MNSKIIAYAVSAHENVNHRYDGHPYSVHLAMVASYAQKFSYLIDSHEWNDIYDACWLHDTIEDCRLSYNDLLKVCSVKTADIVFAVSNEKGKIRKERANDKYYEGIRNTDGAIFVKLCDRLANVKYSIDKKSRMREVYSEENDEFIKSLRLDGSTLYDDMVVELKILLLTDN